MGVSDEISQLRARVAELEMAATGTSAHWQQTDRLRMLFDEAEDPILIYTSGRRPTELIDCNHAAIEFFGYDAAELAAIGYEGLIVPEDLASTPIQRRVEPGEATSRKRRVRRKDGSEAVVEVRAKRLSGEQANVVMVVLRDLSEREIAESNLRDRDERLAIFFDHTPDAILVVDTTTDTVIDSNVVAQSLFGYSADEFLGKAYISLGVPGEFEKRPMVRPPEGRGSEVRVERHFRRGDGSPFLAESRAIYASAGSTFVLIRDITEERARERALEERDARLLVLIEESDDAIFMVDQEMKVVEFNRATVELLGFEPEELYDLSYKSVFAPEAWATFLEEVSLVQEGASLSGLKKLIRKDGQEIDVDLRAKLLPDGRSLVVIRDVTETLRLEEELQQARRMDSISQLAGGIAHEFNNLLTVINGYAEMTLPLLADDAEALRNVEDIHTAGLKAAQLTRQLLDVGQRQMVASKELSLNTLVEDLLRMLRHVVGPTIELSTELEPSLPAVRADAAQIEHVVVNLVVNARDAMPGGGHLRISTATGLNEEELPTVSIAVRDDGTGMDEQVQRHAFDPFFTTKVQGKGMGLGLATTYGIVKQAGGTITVESSPGKGSTFTVTFPAAAHS